MGWNHQLGLVLSLDFCLRRLFWNHKWWNMFFFSLKLNMAPEKMSSWKENNAPIISLLVLCSFYGVCISGCSNCWALVFQWGTWQSIFEGFFWFVLKYTIPWQPPLGGVQYLVYISYYPKIECGGLYLKLCKKVQLKDFFNSYGGQLLNSWETTYYHWIWNSKKFWLIWFSVRNLDVWICWAKQKP